MARASGVTASAITLNIVSGSLTVTASFFVSSADRSRVQITLDRQPSALSATLGVTVLSTPTMRLVEPRPQPNVGDSAAVLPELPALDGALPSSPSLLTIALILAGVANVACAIGCTAYVVLRHRRIRRAKERFGAAAERAAHRRRSVDLEMTDPGAAIAASEAACREVMRKHLKEYVRANGCNANFKAWIATLHPENVQLDQRMWLDQGEQMMLWRQMTGNDEAKTADAPPPSPQRARVAEAPPPSRSRAGVAEAPPPSPPPREIHYRESYGGDSSDPGGEPPPPSPQGFVLEAQSLTAMELTSLPIAPATLATRTPVDSGQRNHLQHGRHPFETPSSVGGNHSRSEAIRGNQTPSSVGVATTPAASLPLPPNDGPPPPPDGVPPIPPDDVPPIPPNDGHPPPPDGGPPPPPDGGPPPPDPPPHLTTPDNSTARNSARTTPIERARLDRRRRESGQPSRFTSAVVVDQLLASESQSSFL